MRSAARLPLPLAAAGLSAALAMGLVAVPAAASASSAPLSASSPAAQTWRWGPTASSDNKGWASGYVRSGASGLRIVGDLYDAGGAGTCSWVKVTWLTDRGKHRTATFRNCSQSTPRTFTVKAGYMLLAKARVCRGSATRITGRCSRWERVWTQGG
ncbi:hypothetical protein GCM10010116_09880 [Microbispora rosea subsp. aerata]|nr:hypothetical protein [Microbispora rosea]GGO04937.1 hypothetical protein GCM10010116_09880 [Microbispora rosea subsp. aerata]GIH56234.1 hypothetical protein Mro02_31480 [Microbispora rosea subsp. aerata]GLJ82326.1 hypothetical protein GCM10017588_10510 [Microbispora rosea subsp. aerata]